VSGAASSRDEGVDPLAPLIRASLKRQYRAGLGMLREAVEACPDDLWYDRTPTNAFWQLAYHTIFFTQAYLGENPAAFEGWPGHQPDVQHPDGIAGPAEPGNALPLIPRPYSRSEALEYLAVCEDMVDGAVDAFDLTAPESGFPNYPIPRLEHQLVNLRHLQHHTAQLADRLRQHSDIAVRWSGSGPRR
jgi:hypothetical protein